MSEPDPVLARRARVSTIATIMQRTGYTLYAFATVVFFYGLFTDFSSRVATLIVIGLVAGSILLAPAIIVGYAVRAADRADRDDDW